MLIDEQLKHWRPLPHFQTPPVFIYGLIDPRTFECRYIGKSIRPKERLSNHLQDRSKCHRTHWLRELKAAGLRPDILILEIAEGQFPWQVSEKAWIAYGRAHGWPLTNNTDGGDGVEGLPPETRERMRQTWLGRKHSAETKRKIGDLKRGVVPRAETREKMRTIMEGRIISWGPKISKALHKLTDEQAQDIVRRSNNGERIKDLAAEFGVHRCTITNIRKGHCGWGTA